MTLATKYLKGMLEAAYDVDFMCDMDDLINADNVAGQILATKYNNADYKYLTVYAHSLHGKAWSEIHRLN